MGVNWIVLIFRLATCAALAAAFHGFPLAPTPAAGSTTSCDAANPFDTLPDDAALQQCLDNYDWVLLKPDYLPGYVGYIISNTVKLKRDRILLTTAENPWKVTFIAARDLQAPLLRASGANDYEISFIRFDGNRDGRSVRDKPCDTTHDFRNLELAGTGFRVRYVESFGAVCGSGMVVGGANTFEIVNSLFYDNGRQPEEANGVSGVWADGLTVFGCTRSTIRDNVLWDNTDVDLGVNGGDSCAVYRNTISHSWKYAFAGLVAGDPSRSGGEFSHNVVSSDYNLLGFGMVVGCHPWGACNGGYASNLWVHDNHLTGAAVNLAVDGLNGGRVENNVMSGAQGDRVLNCPMSADYTAGHVVNLSNLQRGFVGRTFDVGAICQP
jgi:hypothetical protein